MKFSIVMPSLNAARFINAAVGSIAQQTHKDWELIIVDGGSSDGSIDTVISWTEREPRIQLIDLPGSSIYEAIFAGFSVANGQVLSWLNADDLYVDNAFLLVNASFQSDESRNWITGLPSIFDPHGNQCCVYPHMKRPRRLIQNGAFNPNFLGCIQAESTFFRTELFEKLSGEDKIEITSLKLAGDFLLWRKFAQFSSLYSLPNVVGGFRIHGDNKSLLESTHYRDEVEATGARCFSPKIAHRIQQVYRLVTCTRGYAQAQRKNSVLNQSFHVS